MPSAWGRDFRRYVVDYGVIPGHISDKTCQDRLDALRVQAWPNSYGRRIVPDMAAIDGNAYTEEVWMWARRHPAGSVIMVRGANSDNAPLFQKVKREHNEKTGKRLRYSNRFFNFNGSVLKMALYRNVAKTDPLERGFVGFPTGLEDEYYRQLTAERRVPKKRKDGFTEFKWEKDAAQANEALDTMNQAEAAAIRFGIRGMPDKIWDRLEAERETAPPEQQLDLRTASSPLLLRRPHRINPPLRRRLKRQIEQMGEEVSVKPRHRVKAGSHFVPLAADIAAAPRAQAGYLRDTRSGIHPVAPGRHPAAPRRCAPLVGTRRGAGGRPDREFRLPQGRERPDHRRHGRNRSCLQPGAGYRRSRLFGRRDRRARRKERSPSGRPMPGTRPECDHRGKLTVAQMTDIALTYFVVYGEWVSRHTYFGKALPPSLRHFDWPQGPARSAHRMVRTTIEAEGCTRHHA